MFSTYFIPKLIATLFVSLLVIFVLIISAKFINRETFKYLGYYNNIVSMPYFYYIKGVNIVVARNDLDYVDSVCTEIQFIGG